MYRALSAEDQTERAIEEFESDLKHYQAASRRSLFGLLAFVCALALACLVCGGLIYLLR